jgi:hypothetical protein
MDTRRRKFEKVKHKALDSLAKTIFVEPEAELTTTFGKLNQIQVKHIQ